MINVSEELKELSVVQKRCVAAVIDNIAALICSSMVTSLLNPFVILSHPVFEQIPTFIFLYMAGVRILGYVCFFSYFVIQMRLFGKTFGKQIMGLDVIKEDGKKLRFVDIIKREVFAKTVTLPLFGAAWVLMNTEQKAAWDYLVKTKVIRSQ